MNLIVFFSRLSFFLFFLYPQVIFSADPDAIPSLPLSSQVENEGFLWKNRLIIQHANMSVSFEESHSSLYKNLNEFQTSLSSLNPERNIELVKGIILDPECSPTLKEIFKGLNHENKIISEFLNGEEISEELFENETIQSILRKNLERLKDRNVCMASLEYIAKTGERTLKNFYVPHEDPAMHRKPVIFLSDIGNELIRILQETTMFNKFDFITFHRGDQSTSEVSIKFDEFESRLRKFYSKVPIITRFTDHCKVEATRLHTTQQSVEKKGIDLAEIASEEIKKFLEKSNLDESPSDLLKICNILPGIKEMRQNAFKIFKHKFCDSEQAMRYFLFAHIREFLQELHLTADGLLILNLHSVRDPCKYCTNAMFLECHLRNQPAEGEKNLLGFFQKVYHNIKANMPQVFILVSSQILESEGGILRRLVAGRSVDPNTPILTSSDIRLFFRDNNNGREIPIESFSESKLGEKDGKKVAVPKKTKSTANSNSSSSSSKASSVLAELIALVEGYKS